MKRKLWTLWTVFSLAIFCNCGGVDGEEDAGPTPICYEGEIESCGSPACRGERECVDDDWTDCSSIGHSCGDCECRCVPDSHVGAIEERNPQNERCDGIDNDCDGTTDEGCCFDYDDNDEDGYYGESAICPGEDCNDDDADIYPEAPEICDGQDNDCDSEIDENCPCQGEEGRTRSCGNGNCTGHQTCINSDWTVCSSLGEECGECDCVCVENSRGGIVEQRHPEREECDGIDNDCNGETDEGIEDCCEPGDTQTCGINTGECETGLQVCRPDRSWSEECHDEVVPIPEICNNEDDDCDHRIDESFPCRIDEEEECRTSCGTTGTHTCNEDCHWSPCEPPRESCNGIDDDCDGRCDEGYSCCALSRRSCTTSCGSRGSQECSIFCSWPSRCTPPLETCNGRDDDCDGLCDEGYTCCVRSTSGCTTSCGTTGVRVCTTSCGWSGTCTPPDEICNNRDDDCDGSIDEGFTCRQLSSRDCLTSCGTWGTQICNPSCTWGRCTVPAERCNNIDDDCDGLRDEGFACRQGSSGSCTTSCGSTGTRICSDLCTWERCEVPEEECNGRDDDCDGTVDEGCCFDRDDDGYEGESDSCPDGDDCDDSRTSVHPDALEVCDDRDNDCDDRSDNPESIEAGADSNTYYIINSCSGSSDPCCRRPTRRASGRIYRVNFPRETLGRIDPSRITISVSLLYKYYSRTSHRSARIEFMLYNTAGSRISHRTFSFRSPRDSSCSTSTGFGRHIESYSLSGANVSRLDIYVYIGDYGVKVKDLEVSVDPSCG